MLAKKPQNSFLLLLHIIISQSKNTNENICCFLDMEKNNAKTEKEMIIDRNSPKIKDHVAYCQSTYNIPAQEEKDLVLEKLVVIHRHGDRSPLFIDDKVWQKQTCIVCKLDDNKITNCKEQPCKEGELTEKGYNQMIKLGNFIKDKYGSLDLKKTKTRCTTVPRTQSSLHGVIKGLLNKEIVNDVEMFDKDYDSLLVPKDCLFLNTLLSKTISDYFLEITRKDIKYKDESGIPPQRIADAYLSHMCHNIPIDCSKRNCDSSIIEEYIETAFLAWKEQTNKIKTIDNALKVVFGRFASELKEYLTDDTPVRIISVHDSSLSVVLAGLGTKIDKHPSYASAIFVEVWSDPKEKDDSDDLANKYVRIIFNDQVSKTSIDENVNIPLSKLLSYFDILIEDSDEMRNKCLSYDGKTGADNSLHKK